jgi:hypothetical protein
MRILITSITFFLFSLNIEAQFNVAQNFGGGTQSEIRATAMDAANNKLISGTFRSQIIVGDSEYNNEENTNDNAFVAKLNEQGEVLWSSVLTGEGSNGRVNARAIAVHNESGQVCVTGEYRNQVRSGEVVFSEANNKKSLFVALFNSNGNLLWIFNTQADNSSLEIEGLGIAFLGADIIVTGKSKGGDFEINDFTISNPQNKDIGYAIKLKGTDGSVLNAASIFSCGNESAEIVDVKSRQNTLYFSGTMKKNAGIVGANQTLELPNNSTKDQFVVFALDGNFNAVWGKTSENGLKSKGTGVAVSDAGVYTTGEFEEEISFSDEIQFSSYPKKSAFIASYNFDGNINWAKAPNSPISNSEIKFIGLDANAETVLIGGEFIREISWEEFTLDALIAKNGFFARLHSNGTLLNTTAFNSDFENKINAVSINVNNAELIAGQMRGSLLIPGIETQLQLQGEFGSREAFYVYKNGTSTSVNEKHLSEIKLYPNPAKDFVYLKLPQNIQQTHIQILDVNGRVLLKQVVNNDIQSMDISQLNSGIYFIRIINENQFNIQKLIKQ